MHHILFKVSTFCLLLIIYSCSEEKDNNSEKIDSEIIDTDTSSLADKLDMKDGETRMFTMPTPLQTAAALQIMNVEYTNQLLIEHNIVNSKSDIDLAMILGMYMVDLGYTTIYNNSQESLNYAKDIQDIMDELPIGYYVNDAFRKRFKQNLNDKDSLCKVILEGYNDANQFMIENQNEGLGLLILTGAYIESLYLISSSKVGSEWNQEYNNLFIQQKLFLENFITLLAPYNSNEKINHIYNDLNKLSHFFNKIETTFDEKTQQFQLVKPITPKQFKSIQSKISIIRSNIIKS